MKKGIFTQFRATGKVEIENLRFFVLGFRSIRNGLSSSIGNKYLITILGF